MTEKGRRRRNKEELNDGQTLQRPAALRAASTVSPHFARKYLYEEEAPTLAEAAIEKTLTFRGHRQACSQLDVLDRISPPASFFLPPSHPSFSFCALCGAWGFLVESVPDSIHLCTSLRWIGSLERSSLPSREAIYSISELFELPISADWGQGVDATFPTQTST